MMAMCNERWFRGFGVESKEIGRPISIFGKPRCRDPCCTSLAVGVKGPSRRPCVLATAARCALQRLAKLPRAVLGGRALAATWKQQQATRFWGRCAWRQVRLSLCRLCWTGSMKCDGRSGVCCQYRVARLRGVCLTVAVRAWLGWAVHGRPLGIYIVHRQGSRRSPLFSRL